MRYSIKDVTIHLIALVSFANLALFSWMGLLGPPHNAVAANTNHENTAGLRSATSHSQNSFVKSTAINRLISRAPRRQFPNVLPINVCPPRYAPAVYNRLNIFVSSQCDPADISRRAYTISCRSNHYDYRFQPPTVLRGRCRYWEMCFQARGPMQNAPGDDTLEAWCVSYFSFIPFARLVVGDRDRRQRRATLDLGGGGKKRKLDPNGKNSLDVVFSTGGHNSNEPLMVEKVVIQPLLADRTPVGRAEQCRDCMRLGLSPWPKGTAYFDVDVTMPSSADQMLLNYYFDKMPASS